MTHYEFHEYANIFPMLEGKDLEALRADIEANGQINKIILYQGKVLDGRNRYWICEMLGIEPETIVYPGDDPIGLVLSQNLHRRHLDESQRAMVATKLATLPPHRPAKENKSANLRTYPQDAEKQEATTQSGAISQPEAAKMLNVSERQVQSAAQLRREAPPEIIGQVERGEKTVHAALKEIGQPVAGKDGKLRPAKYNPRKKTVAKESDPEPEPKPTGKFIQVDKRWEKEIALWSKWWETMPNAYQQLTGGETMTGCMQVPVPFHHNMMMAMFRKMCDDAGDKRDALRDTLIAEVKLLADRIDELND